MKTITSFICILASFCAYAAEVTLIWDANPASDEVVEYRIYVGTASRTYTRIESAGTATQLTVTGIDYGVTNYYACTAVNRYGVESDFSNEVAHAVAFPKPSAPILRLKADQASWRQTTPTKAGTVTPILVIPTDPAVRVTAKITTPAGQVTKSATAGTAGVVELTGRAAIPPYKADADITTLSFDPDVQTSALIE